MAVLYTTYRPKKFADVVGQTGVVQTLKNALAQEKLAHAYLFTGSRGVGKTSLARILAKTVNCVSKNEGEACGTCPPCLAFTSGGFLDLQEIDAASNTGVDNIRELIEHVAFRPSLGKYKVYIIDEVHMLSKGAFNALLKTLEEPPEHALFILATTEIQKVPATIISRTQRFDFGKLTSQEISDQLQFVVKAELLTVPESVTELIAKHSAGGLRDALTRLEKVLTLGENVNLETASLLLGVTDSGLVAELLGLVIGGESSHIPGFFERLRTLSVDPHILTKDILESFRLLMVAKLTGEIPESVDVELVAKVSIVDCVYLSRIFLKAYKDTVSSPDPDLPLLLACVEGAMRFAKPIPVQVTKIEPQSQIKSQLQSPPVIRTEVDFSNVVFKPEQVNSTQSVMGENLDESKVRLLWNTVVERVKEKNGPLGTLLKNSPLDHVDGNTIVIAVKYLFHKEHVESTKNSQLIGIIITEIIGSPANITAKIVKEEISTDTNAVTAEALQVFGGEIIE